MQIKSLTLTQFRAFEQATFEFQPGMNLLVGINGVGKSTVLDAIRILLSQVLPKFTASKSKPITFTARDIKFARGALTAEIKFDAEETAFNYLVHQPQENYIAITDREGEVRGQTYELVKRQDLQPDVKDIPKHIKTSSTQPLAVYFSTRRSLASIAAPSKQISAGGQAAAFAEALSERELRLREYADWLLVQEALVQERRKSAQQHLDALKRAVTTFMDKCTGLHAVREPETTLFIDKDGVSLDVRQLSDGERGILALVLDLAKRLSQANPKLEDPLRDGKAVVLIDELDLHLHPQWQRTIVEQLTQTFPNCQFIATTHSPLIIGEVKPPGLTLITKEDNGIVVLQKELQGFGLASNWILEQLMGTASRNATTQAQINLVEDALEEGELEVARDRLEKLITMMKGYDDEATRLEASINNLEALAEEVDLEDEMDSEEE
ncbi:AAA family ATPase [Anabaena sp. UHCC 0187]|uniref:AAA family ATPase n=1 Tax=Anabaena sp. UHCC 0187 TaxID=2590018 RepID=UPI0014454489|nr:AAA family ATPase [Anabaena sp. UHCC 0187]MDM3848120.1 AAA family ATPase [Aphanizomenon gracile PMC638.10]MTJ12868.1 AAA family ATPase [Anabaena sp. UHCC 0187]